MRVLFVDDEPDVLHGLQCSLRRQRKEWDMHFAESGDEALSLFAKQPFEVIVSDVRMPGMDGVTLLTTVREQYPSAIRIILSGHAGEDAVLRAVGPAHQYMAKPCDPEELRTTVRAAFALREVLTDERLKQLVARLSCVPSLPSVYQEILSELRSDEPSIRNVAEIVAKDVGMTAKVLQLVNSAFFGLPNEITDTTRAVMHLGTDTVRALALTTGVFSQMAGERPDSSHIETLWAHSTRVASLAKRIAELEDSSKEVLGASYQGGFLHDIGQLVLAANLSDQYSGVLRAAEADRGSLIEHERATLGTTHAHVGGYLLGIWGLPDLVVQAVTFHHEPSSFPSKGFSPLAAVHVAEAFDREHACDGSPRDEKPQRLDHDYLKAAEIDGRVEAWTNACREMLEEEVTS